MLTMDGNQDPVVQFLVIVSLPAYQSCLSVPVALALKSADQNRGTVYSVDMDLFFVIGTAIGSMAKNIIQNIGSIGMKLWNKYITKGNKSIIQQWKMLNIKFKFFCLQNYFVVLLPLSFCQNQSTTING